MTARRRVHLNLAGDLAEGGSVDRIMDPQGAPGSPLPEVSRFTARGDWRKGAFRTFAAGDGVAWG